MMTDYEPFLRVTEDGCIWWVLMNAIRLGAGYLPFRDDHKTLITELRAPNDRAQVNERTLIGAFNDARLKIERPITIDRDGFRYVEAEEFLTWLSQYIEQTQAMEITFPSTLPCLFPPSIHCLLDDILSFNFCNRRQNRD